MSIRRGNTTKKSDPCISVFRKPAFLIVAAYAILSFLLLLHHEPWRDEAQGWLIARDCTDLAALFHLMGYEGTPALWHLLLVPLARLGMPFVAASFLNFAIILGAVILLVRYAPFSLFHKALIIFGYYFFYEYCVFARNYSFIVLLLFLIATFYENRFKRPILHASLLALLANTSLHGLVIAIILGGFYVLEILSRQRMRLSAVPLTWSLIVLLGFAVSVLQMWPPVDVMPPRGHFVGTAPSLINIKLTYDHLMVVPHVLVGAFWPIPLPTLHFWNSKLVYLPIENLRECRVIPTFSSILYSAALLLPAGLSLGLFARKTFPFFLYTTLTLGLVGVFFLIYEAGVRHQGLITVIFVFCLWVSTHYTERAPKKFPSSLKIFDRKYHNGCITILLILQLLATSVAGYFDLKYDFSYGKKTARVLTESGLLKGNVLIATYQSHITCSIIPYLKRPYDRLYSLEYRDMRSFMTWDRTYLHNKRLSVQDIMDRIEHRALKERYDSVLFISTREIYDRRFRERFDGVERLENPIAGEESFYIYRLKDRLSNRIPGGAFE